jgi:hypothetical protein
MQLNVTPGRLNTHLAIESSETYAGRVKPDNITEKIAEWLPKDASGALSSCTQSADDFVRQLEEEATFVPVGELVKREEVEGNTSVETYLYDGTTSGAIEYASFLSLTSCSFKKIDSRGMLWQLKCLHVGKGKVRPTTTYTCAM